MPRVNRRPPAEVKEAFRAGLAVLRRSGDRGVGTMGVAEEKSSPQAPPHRVFSLGVRPISAGRGLSASVFHGWRYIMPTPDAKLEAIEVAATADGFHFAGIHRGRALKETMAAMPNTLKSLAKEKRSFEVAFLRLPALHVSALWVITKGGEDRAIPIAPVPKALVAGKIYSEAEFLAALAPEAARILRLSTGTKGG